MLAWTMEFAGATGNCPREGSCAEDEPPRYIDELDPWEWPAVARGRPGASAVIRRRRSADELVIFMRTRLRRAWAEMLLR